MIYTVGTFYKRKAGRPVRISHIQAYTVWFNPEWDDCIVYEIEASSGEEAKHKAREKRLEYELEQ